MASQSAVLQQCFQEAARAAKPLLEHCIEPAIAALQDAELKSMKVAERDELGAAWRGLQSSKSAWCDQYPRALLKAFDAAHAAGLAEQARAPNSTRGDLRIRTDQLALVDDALVDEKIESSRLLQYVLPMVERELAELDALVSTAQGLDTVSPELNPLRPDVFVQTLRELLSSAAAEPATVSLWTRQMAAPLGRELKALYERLAAQLARANVHAAGYRVLQTPAGASGWAKLEDGGASGPAPLEAGDSGSGRFSGHSSHAGLGGSHSGPQPLAPAQYADLAGYGIADPLFQDFLYRGGTHAQQPLQPAYYASVEEELAQLQAMPAEPAAAEPPLPEIDHSVPVVDRPQRFVDVLSQLSSKVWGIYGQSRERSIVRTQLKKDATRVGQVLGLEVVRKLVNQVAQDPRLLAPVREAIVALEPSLLRLAMINPRFFAEEQHAARRLVESVAQRSFKYNDELASDFTTFFTPVAESFTTLNGQDIQDPVPFATVLDQLETQWSEQDRQETEQRSGVLETLRYAEERQAHADQIAYDLSLRPDLDQVPAVVLDFLFGPWSLVMAHARMTAEHKQLDPGGYGAIVTDLLWSVKLEETLKQPAKLISLIPPLLSKLRAGLALLGQDPKENAPIFDALMKLHAPVLELRRARSQRDAAESSPVPLETVLPELPIATPEQRIPKAHGQPWLGPREQNAAGFEETVPSDRAPLDAGPTPDALAEPINLSGDLADEAEVVILGDELTPEQVLAGLREGCWVDLYSKQRWLRAQLVWASNKGTLFMFVSHGGQPHSMTKRSCERLILQRHLRPVDMQDVVAHALQTLAEAEA